MKLPPKKKRGDPVLAADWNTMVEALAARTPRPCSGMELVCTSSGFLYRPRQLAGASGGTTCRAFFALETHNVGDTPHLFLATGQVMGGTGNLTPEIDLGPLDSPPEENLFVWLEITGDGIVADDVLLPGFNVSSAVVGSGASMPPNVSPTAEQPEGAKVHVLLGRWRDGTFLPVQCGNIETGFCPPESFRITRT